MVRWLLVVVLVVAACGGRDQSTDATTVTSTTSTIPITTTTEAATTTTTEAATTTTRTVELVALPSGDAAAGEELFGMPMAVRLNDSCAICHSEAGASRGYGPLLDGITDIAGERVDGLSAEEYLQQSIVAPAAYALEGWGLHMPKNYREILTDQDLADLVAYLLTQ